MMPTASAIMRAAEEASPVAGLCSAQDCLLFKYFKLIGWKVNNAAEKLI